MFDKFNKSFDRFHKSFHVFAKTFDRFHAHSRFTDIVLHGAQEDQEQRNVCFMFLHVILVHTFDL